MYLQHLPAALNRSPQAAAAEAVAQLWGAALQPDAVQNGWAQQHNCAIQLQMPVTREEIHIAGNAINWYLGLNKITRTLYCF